MANKICNGHCYGCTACKSICPRKAISMVENEKGFCEPVIDESKCINCNLCRKVCNSKTEFNKIKNLYIVKNKDFIQHLSSQSGGAFSAISDIILNNNGVVFGVTIDNNFEGVFTKAANKKERDMMHGSKYMQAKLNDVFDNVKSALETNKVLFAGTPCQVAGLKKYLELKKCNCDNLYTVDIICHGTPSVKVWRKVIDYIEEKNGKTKYAICRDKVQTGWGGSNSTFYGNQKISNNIFCRIFFTDLCLNESCYHCEYARKDRVGDITIGDAWGVKNINPEFYDTRGVSLMLVNSKKGEELFKSLKDSVDYKEVREADYIQKNLTQPSKPHRNVEEFWNDFNNKKFNYVIKKYGKNNIFLNYKYVIKKGMSLICKKR